MRHHHLPRPHGRSRAHEARHQGRRHHHPVRRPLHARAGSAENGLPRSAHARRAHHRVPQYRAALRHEGDSRGHPHRRRGRLQAHAVRQHGRPVPGGGRAVRQPVRAPASHALLRHRRLDRAQPSGPAGIRHGRGLHQGGQRQDLHPLLRRAPPPHPGGDVRHHGLPRADHADIHGYERLLGGQGRQAAQGYGQEEARRHARVAGRLEHRRGGERLSAGNREADLGRRGEIR